MSLIFITNIFHLSYSLAVHCNAVSKSVCLRRDNSSKPCFCSHPNKWCGAFDNRRMYNSSTSQSAIDNGFCFRTACNWWVAGRHIRLMTRCGHLCKWLFVLSSQFRNRSCTWEILVRNLIDRKGQTTHLLPGSNDPSERVNARILALTDLPRLLVFGQRQMRTILRIDARSILNWMRIVGGSWIESHANRLLYSHASSASRRALRRRLQNEF